MSWIKLINSENFVWNTKLATAVNSFVDSDILTNSYNLSSCFFNINKDAYEQYLLYLEHNMGRYNSIAEYGCGNGSNLYYFAKKHKSIVYGCDISEHLINACKVALPEYKNNFFATNKFLIPDLSVDVCVSNSVFQYFPSYEYAATVISEMLRVANNNVIITDIKDIRYADQFKENQARRKNISIDELKKLYKDTPLRFYSRDFFLQFGDVKIIDMPSSYTDSEFKSFSVMINKSVR